MDCVEGPNRLERINKMPQRCGVAYQNGAIHSQEQYRGADEKGEDEWSRKEREQPCKWRLILEVSSE